MVASGTANRREMSPTVSPLRTVYLARRTRGARARIGAACGTRMRAPARTRCPPALRWFARTSVRTSVRWLAAMAVSVSPVRTV